MVSKPLDVPRRTNKATAPLRDTLSNITVIFFAQLGIPVKLRLGAAGNDTGVGIVIDPPLSVELLIVAPDIAGFVNVAPVIAPIEFTVSTSDVVAPLLPLANLIVPSGEDGTERVKFWSAVADWPI